MASEDTIVKKLIINDMTEEEFEAKKAAGELDPNQIYVTPDKTDDKLAGKVSVAQGKENAGKVLVISENGEVVPGEVAPAEPQAGASMPILTHVFADHKLNDISWLNADTFSWQSGDVYVAAYEHLFEESNGKEGVSETIAGITVWFVQADDGHKVCPASEEANVQALYEKTGVAWYYIIDEANKRFKLPRTKFVFTGLRDSVGKYVPAGVPNITGSFGNTISQSDSASATSGAFALGTNWDNKVAGSSGNLKGQQYTFNASRSSSVYGSSNTVQPPATQMYLYFYVGNFEREAIEQTAGLNAELFNSKADSNLKNTPLQVDSTGKILVSGTTLAQSTNNRELRLQVGDDVSNGSLLALYGKNSTLGAQGFLLRACLTPGEYNDLVGRTDGKLLWKSKRIPSLESEQLPTVDGGYVWYKVYDDGFVMQGGRCIGEWPIAQGAEQVPYVTMAIPMNTTHIYPFFMCKELYCLPMGWYMTNSTTLRPRFGAYTVARTLTQFDWVAFGRKA